MTCNLLNENNGTYARNSKDLGHNVVSIQKKTDFTIDEAGRRVLF